MNNWWIFAGNVNHILIGGKWRNSDVIIPVSFTQNNYAQIRTEASQKYVVCVSDGPVYVMYIDKWSAMHI